jgi:hypothetical protein
MAEVPLWRQLLSRPIEQQERGSPGPNTVRQAPFFGPDFVSLPDTELPAFNTPVAGPGDPDGGGGRDLPPFTVFPPRDGELPPVPLDPREQISQEGADFDVPEYYFDDDESGATSGGFRSTLPRWASMVGGLVGGPLVGAGLAGLREVGLEGNRLYGNDIRGMVGLEEVEKPGFWDRFGFGDDPRLSGYDENFRAIEDEMIDRRRDETERMIMENPGTTFSGIGLGGRGNEDAARHAARTELAGATFNDPRAGIASNIGGTFANPYVSYNNTGTPGAAPIGYRAPDLTPGATDAVAETDNAIQGALDMIMGLGGDQNRAEFGSAGYGGPASQLGRPPPDPMAEVWQQYAAQQMANQGAGSAAAVGPPPGVPAGRPDINNIVDVANLPDLSLPAGGPGYGPSTVGGYTYGGAGAGGSQAQLEDYFR